MSRRLAYIYFNRAPSAAPENDPESSDGKQIVVTLNGQSNNGYGVTYTIKTGPRYGTLVPGTVPGTYIPDPGLVQPGITDSFVVTVDNGTQAQRPGLAGVLQQKRHQRAIDRGLSQADTTDELVTVNVLGDGVYGNAQYAKQYWVSQSYSNCALQASASAVGQALRSAPPSEAYVVSLAKATDSVVKPAMKMYLDENIDEGAYAEDTAVLMEKYFNVTATHTTASTVDEDGNHVAPTAQDAQRRLQDRQVALASGDAAMVAYSTAIVWSAVTDSTPQPGDSFFTSDHAVVVTEVDLPNGVVYVNDSSMTDHGQSVGRGKALPMGVFLAGWQASDYDLTVVAPRTPPPVTQRRCEGLTSQTRAGCRVVPAQPTPVKHKGPA